MKLLSLCGLFGLTSMLAAFATKSYLLSHGFTQAQWGTCATILLGWFFYGVFQTIIVSRNIP